MHGPKGFHHGLRQQWLESAPAHRRTLPSGRFTVFATQQGVEPQQVGGFRPFGVIKLQANHWIGFGTFDLLGNQVRGVKQIDSRTFIWVALAHLGAAIGEAHNPGPLPQDQGFRHLQKRLLLTAKATIYPLLRYVSRQFQVLFLVFPHRHLVGVIEKNVCGHQDRVIEQPHRNVVTLFERLFLELDHPLQPVQRR